MYQICIIAFAQILKSVFCDDTTESLLFPERGKKCLARFITALSILATEILLVAIQLLDCVIPFRNINNRRLKLAICTSKSVLKH